MATTDLTMADGESKDDKSPSSPVRDSESAPDIQLPKKKRQRTNPHHTRHLATIRKPSWTYFHLQLFSPATSTTNESLDILTAKRYLAAALQRFLGLHGSAILMDILKLEAQKVWIRVPREDAAAVHEALAGWMGDGVRWKVNGRDDWLARLAMGSGEGGQDLFNP